MFNGIVFDNRYVRAKDMGMAFQAAFNADCILNGCAITANGADIVLGTGFLSIAGRVIQVMAAETITATQTSGYARVKIVIDLARTSTPELFEQVLLAIEYSSTISGFSSLIHGDINAGNDQVYEAEICTVTLNSSGVDTFIAKMQAPHTATYVTQQVTIAVEDWEGGTTCTKDVAGVTATNQILASSDPSTFVTYRNYGVRVSSQEREKVTFVCDSTPNETVIANLMVVN